MDVEPKKREMYETATTNNEYLSGSSDSLTVGKSNTATDSLENANILTGASMGGNYGAGFQGASLSLGGSGSVFRRMGHGEEHRHAIGEYNFNGRFKRC